MELPQVASLQDNAQSVVRAAQYVGRAADELRPLVVPAARTALEKVPGAASCAISRVKRVTPQTIREHSLAAGIVGGVLAAGLAAATVAHFVHRHKVARTYRLHRKHDALAAERQRTIEATLSKATWRCTAAEFEQHFGEDGNPALAQVSGPGCYAILAFDPEPQDGDLSAYRDVYVGAASSMAQGVHKQLSGEGNLYVHADIVYEQPVYVLFFPCEGYQLYASKERLMNALGAVESYNKIDEVANID